MEFHCNSKKCKGKKVPPVIVEVPDNEKPAGVTAIAYRVKCFNCHEHIRIISQSEYTAYMHVSEPFKPIQNPNAVPDNCYKCGMPGERLLYVWYGSSKFGTRKACLKCEPYPVLSTDKKIVL
jgi:hypothetical protein